jgi:hypothetical protein
VNKPGNRPNQSKPRPITATKLAQYVTSLGRCERFLRFALYPDEFEALKNRYGVKTETLSPMLAEAGNAFEREVVREIGARASVVDLQHKKAHEFVEVLRQQQPGRVLYYQVSLTGLIGRIDCEGIADLIEITRQSNGTIDAVVIDIKASRRESMRFRLQIAFYARLLRETLVQAGVRCNSVRGAVVSRGENLTTEELEQFELGLYEDEIERLIALPHSDLERILAGTLDEANYHLSSKCDGCPHNPVCFIDTAEHEDLSLVPLLTATEKRALLSAGIRSARELAGLMTYNRQGMDPAPGHEADVARIVKRWPLGGRLPALVQRARGALKQYDTRIEAKPFILGSGFGSLPDPQRYPDLIKVFIDGQFDYIEDRIYLIAGLIVAPDRTIEVVEMSDQPPDAAVERDLLIKWLQRLLQKIAEAAGVDFAPLHIYLFDRNDQSVLLSALTRHFDLLCAIPAFYDLLTSSPALTQGMVSFLKEEVCERRNLSPICLNLYRVAAEMGFAWREDKLNFWERFRSSAFDSHRSFIRDRQTGEFQRVNADERNKIQVEAGARFSTQIPLEYAYSAWGKLGESESMSPDQLVQIRGFLGITKDELCRLAAHRCRALHHIEQQFSRKNRHVEKSPLALTSLGKVHSTPHEIPLNRSLEDFLLLEHYAKHQTALLRLSQPPEQRAQTGGTAILKCEQYHPGDREIDRGVFSLVQSNGQPARGDELRALRLREGSWVVLNPLLNEEGLARPASALVGGRLCVIEGLDEGRMELRLPRMNFRRTRFRYGHWNFDPLIGFLYTLDEMVDDLNADKYLEACRHADHNQLYRWMNEAYLDPAAPKPERPIRPSRLRTGREMAELAAQSQQPFGLTEAQRKIVGEYFTQRALVVQGPPGTGKSHTIGFAILARALALKSPARPFRVAVAAKTHAAVEIVLTSIIKRMNDLFASNPNNPRLNLLKQARIIKIGNAAGDIVPDGVELVLAEGNEEQSASEQWQDLMTENLLIIGGTPGGLYRLVKGGTARGRQLDWSEEYFDLVVVDEASQMSITEALTAAAFLNHDGQFIAVGDHRQMPPILAHTWDRDNRRDLQRARPHLSIFEYLIELGFPRTALDESFRVPAEIADFLGRHVYARDGIDYRSQNRCRLAAVSEVEDWISAVLAPEYPLILIEHDEEGSQQSNECEAGLIEILARTVATRLHLDAKTGIGIVVPHRAQKSLLASRLPMLAQAVDTVERFQGGERELIIVSATVSDRDFAEAESQFLLEPRRLTVAVSRPKKKLILLAARTVFEIIPSDLDEYERGSLWKKLRRECAQKLIWEGQIGGHQARIYAIPPNIQSV